MQRKAVALLSGGLDSSLAVKLMLDQGIEIAAVNFTSPFCTCTPRSAGCKHQASRIAEEFGVPIIVLPKGMDYLQIVRSPAHGHGRGMNPCIDCRIYMLVKVRELMPTIGAGFVITGEVLGQRPMSQHREAIGIIERASGLEGLILRPLSAGLFPPTVPEQEGVVDRQQLLSLSGRSRRPQMDLAAQLGITDYPCPAGGCLLTDPLIAARIKDLFAHCPAFDMTDVHLLKYGRHYRLNPGLKVILGRDQTENAFLETCTSAERSLFLPQNFRGPAALARGAWDMDAADTIGALMVHFTKDTPSAWRIRTYDKDNRACELMVTRSIPAAGQEDLLIGPAGRKHPESSAIPACAGAVSKDS